MRLTDETLMAYVDGELDPAARAAVEVTLATDAEARERVVEFRESKELLAAAVAETMQGPVPERLVDAVLRTPVGRPDHAVVPLARATARPSLRQRLALPLAASVALAIGLATGYGIVGRGGDGTSPLAAVEESVAAVLQGTASGETVVTAAGAVTPIASVRRGDGSICREFEIVPEGDAPMLVGVACRTAEKRWRAQGLFVVHAAETTDGFTPASGEPVQADLLEIVARDATTLSGDDEAELLSAGWE